MPIDTKQMISDHLTSLLMKKNLEDITVKCLVEDCRISSQTFYYHFQDLTDVIQWKIHQRIQQSLQDSLKAASLKEAIRIFVSGAEENRKLLKKLLDSPRRAQMEGLLVQAVHSYLRELFGHRFSGSPITGADLDALLCFCSYGMTGLLLNQASQKSAADHQLLTEQLCRLLTGEMFHLIQNS